MTFKKKIVQDNSEEELEDGSEQQTLSLKEKAEVVGDKSNRFRRVTPIVVNQKVYDPLADWEIDHSGTDDPNGGPPKYDESPVPGGFMVATNYLHTRKGELVNASGFEIDPDDRSNPNGTAVVLDPDRYKDTEPDIR